MRKEDRLEYEEGFGCVEMRLLELRCREDGGLEDGFNADALDFRLLCWFSLEQSDVLEGDCSLDLALERPACWVAVPLSSSLVFSVVIFSSKPLSFRSSSSMPLGLLASIGMI
jgi:hypothetical protein